MPWTLAHSIAEGVLSGLHRARAITSGAIAGSVRREKVAVHDIEIVAIPKMRAVPGKLPGEMEPDLPLLREVLHSEGWQRGPPNKAGAQAPNGPRYLKLVNGDGIQLDLFLVFPPSQWGVVYFIRTGSAEWSRAVVTRLHRYGLKSENGHIARVATGEILPCDEEECVFVYGHLPYRTPNLRSMDIPETRALFEPRNPSGEPRS
jgi:DNA polymerase/3'-5' exonuclease PolX